MAVRALLGALLAGWLAATAPAAYVQIFKVLLPVDESAATPYPRARCHGCPIT